MEITYKEFKEALRELNPNLSCKVLKEMYDVVYGIPATSGCITLASNSLADCPKAYCPPPATPQVCKQQEGNNPMSAYASATVAAATTETQDQRKYLERRLQDVYDRKRSPLEAQFGLVDDEAPSSVEDFKKRIEDGAYTFRTGDRYRYWHWSDKIQWRHPDRKQDSEGFEAARKELKVEKQKALDIIKIDEPKAGLDAIKALEAWEPTGAAN